MNDLGNKKIMSENIRYYMELNHKTRTDICEALKISYTTFSDWYNGKKYPRIDKIEMLANYFGIQKKDLVEERNIEETSVYTRVRVDVSPDFEFVSDSLEKLSEEDVTKLRKLMEITFPDLDNKNKA